jgi:DNA gyrase/topoisomerase IV subunit A
MAIDFNSLLTKEQKAAIVANSLQQLAAQAYTLELNKKAVEESNIADKDDRLVSIAADEETLAKAIEVYQSELAELQK